MKRSFRYLWQSIWVNLSVLAGFGAVVLAGCLLTGVPKGVDNLFSQYLGMFPLMSVMILFILSFAMCTSNLEIAVSYGARRADFFWALQGAILVYALGAAVMSQIAALVPSAMGWENESHFLRLLSFGLESSVAYFLITVALLGVGCMCGLLYVRSRLWGILVMMAFVLFGVTAVVVMLITANHGGFGSWSVPVLLGGGLAVAFAASELVLWRVINRYCVR